MTSQIDICNQALADIGTRSTISSLAEDSPEARACAQQYDNTLDQVLRAAHWGFARAFRSPGLLKAAPGTPEATTTSLTWDTTWPPPPWRYSYAFPTDCVAARYLMQPETARVAGIPIFPGGAQHLSAMGGPKVRWMKASDGNAAVIATDAQSPILCYTKRVTNPDLWDPGFKQAMISGLAAQIAFPITGDLKIKATMVQASNDTILAARAQDGNEGLVIYDHLPDWIQARGYGRGYALPGDAPVEPFGPLFS